MISNLKYENAIFESFSLFNGIVASPSLQDTFQKYVIEKLNEAITLLHIIQNQ